MMVAFAAHEYYPTVLIFNSIVAWKPCFSRFIRQEASKLAKNRLLRCIRGTSLGIGLVVYASNGLITSNIA